MFSTINNVATLHYAKHGNRVDDEDLATTIGGFVTAAKNRQLLLPRDTQANSRTLSLTLEVRADLVLSLVREDGNTTHLSAPAPLPALPFMVSRLKTPQYASRLPVQRAQQAASGFSSSTPVMPASLLGDMYLVSLHLATWNSEKDAIVWEEGMNLEDLVVGYPVIGSGQMKDVFEVSSSEMVLRQSLHI